MKIVYIVNVSWFFHSHFYKLAKHNLEKGHTVYIITGDEEKRGEYENQGFSYHNYGVTRDGTNPLNELKVVIRLFKLLKNIRPDLLHAFTIKPVLYSGLLTKIFKSIRPSRAVFSITGLGSLSLSESTKAKALWRIVESVYKLALSQPQATVVFENSDDRALFVSADIVPEERTALVNGAGIDTQYFLPQESTGQFPIVVFLARMLKDKGAREFIEAARILKHRHVDVVMKMVGGVDDENISSLKEAELTAAHNDGVIEFLGHRTDVKEIYQQADIACLPSYREGLPKSLIEAASCGLAIVTSDTPGCRQLIDINAPNGLLVPVKQAENLADAIQTLVEDDALRQSFGVRSREIAEEKYDYSSVLASFDTLYNN
ncbi:glycosyltransferase family 4 protein [Vibrio tapetis subsp. quintayensis]|uniref:glycosyltransferase family 4 protein n=1 Tax=Vibrio tapetis TaxID=52443 RepID=UPI0025B58345|nr:glycosyltransferase family 4 protein [Vibrio tapetis]MDN3679435.1 glycosyltransferase family 4 protein [Vibrio tapetis subsp. quintayensis]